MEEDNMELLNTHPIKKSDLGFHGNLFGGNYWHGWMQVCSICNASL
jgi:hypothetical protein